MDKYLTQRGNCDIYGYILLKAVDEKLTENRKNMQHSSLVLK